MPHASTTAIMTHLGMAPTETPVAVAVPSPPAVQAAGARRTAPSIMRPESTCDDGAAGPEAGGSDHREVPFVMARAGVAARVGAAVTVRS